MEAFTLLKYWRGAGLVGLSPSSETTATILSAVSQNDNETTESEDDDNNNDQDEGPFFDLEFTAPEEEEEEVCDDINPNKQQQDEEQEESEDETETESEFKITLSPSSNNERNDVNLSLSPTEDIQIVELKPSSFLLNNPSEPNSKPQFTASLLKSATKFRVFMSGLKKTKNESVITHKKQKPNRIKFKIEEVPIVSLFTRDNSSKANINSNKSQTNQHEALSPLEEKRFSKEVVMHKYLKMVKPLYIRVSRRYSHGEKVDKFGSASTENKVEGEVATEGETVAETEENNVKSTQTQNQKLGNIPAGLRVVYKHLGKSRSASSAVAASPPALASSKRRDDSLLQQQDGIQGAILHCKRSFNASRECESSSQLPRSVSDLLHEISSELSRKSSDKSVSG